MDTIQLIAENDSTKVLIDGQEISGITDVVIEKHGMSYATVQINATLSNTIARKVIGFTGT